jgi:tetrahydromethanopterin S-methyltransferase subunit G
MEALATSSGWGLFIRLSVMTPADSLSLILRRLDEIERKLDRMMEELKAPTAIGYSVGRGNRPRKD